MRLQTQKLTQVHCTVGHLTNLVQAQVAREEAQWLGMRTWMQEREEKWDTCHQDDKLWGVCITNLIARVMKGVTPGWEAGEKECHNIAGMDGWGLEASPHADTTEEAGPENRL